jgi:hypothetical protein
VPALSDRATATLRTIRWLPLIAAWIVGTAVVVLLREREAASTLQAVAILFACGAGYAFDDPAAELLTASPTSLLRRRIARLALVLPPTVAIWLVLVGVQGPASGAELWALVALFAGLLGLSLSIAGVAERRSPAGRGGIVAAPALFVLLVASSLVPPRWRPLPMGDVPGGWGPIYLRWSAAAAIGLFVLLWSSRDRAHGSLRHRILQH